jgi:hypothetical protein
LDLTIPFAKKAELEIIIYLFFTRSFRHITQVTRISHPQEGAIRRLQGTEPNTSAFGEGMSFPLAETVSGELSELAFFLVWVRYTVHDATAPGDHEARPEIVPMLAAGLLNPWTDA